MRIRIRVGGGLKLRLGGRLEWELEVGLETGLEGEYELPLEGGEFTSCVSIKMCKKIFYVLLMSKIPIQCFH